jgi:ethanolamine ammonia-lyase large subunit
MSIVTEERMYSHCIGSVIYRFPDFKTLLAKATPIRSGDQLAGIAAASLTEMVAAQYALADLPLKTFLTEFTISPDTDEISRLILKQHDHTKFQRIAHFTVGELRDFLLSYACDTAMLTYLQYAVTPEMAAAVSKLMRNQDLIAVAKKCRVVTRFRNTIGLENCFATRLQPNDPCDDLAGITSSIIDGLIYGCGDAVIGINPVSDDSQHISKMHYWLDHVRQKLQAPVQTCVLAHITTTMLLAERGVPVDLFFQSIAGSETANKSFGVTLSLLREAHAMALSLQRGTVGTNCMYFETGQGSALSANAHHGVDQQTVEARGYAVAREFSPLLVNSVVGFIGPEYLLDGKQIIRAGLEDHFCGKLLGLPMGCDICYTNHSYADQNDMDNMLALLALAGCNFVMAVPGADDVMLNYQSTSYHDAVTIRKLLNYHHSPEFSSWLESHDLWRNGKLNPLNTNFFHQLLLEAKNAE